MCDRYAFYIEKDTPGAECFPGLAAFPPKYNAAAGDVMPIIRWSHCGSLVSGARFGFTMRGEHGAPRKRIANVRPRQLSANGAFGESYRGLRRCLVPARGFFGWQTHDWGFRALYFAARDGAILMMAGVFEDSCRNDELSTFAIVVVEARRGGSLVPLLVNARRQEAWLRAPDALERLVSADAPELVSYQVSTRVAHVTENDPALLMPARRGRPRCRAEARSAYGE
jgi:putative SOS response-associated peptidase YedK